MAEYIERMTAISVACKGCNKEFPNEPCEPAECYIQQGLFAIPTAGVVEVRHGEWVESDIPDEKYVCSVCGGACWYYDYQGDLAKSRYCPNCGAQMDRKGDNNG